MSRGWVGSKRSGAGVGAKGATATVLTKRKQAGWSQSARKNGVQVCYAGSATLREYLVRLEGRSGRGGWCGGAEGSAAPAPQGL